MLDRGARVTGATEHRGRRKLSDIEVVAAGKLGVGPFGSGVGRLYRTEQLGLESICGLIVKPLVSLSPHRERGGDLISGALQLAQQPSSSIGGGVAHGPNCDGWKPCSSMC
jgi:hypothetical protein